MHPYAASDRKARKMVMTFRVNVQFENLHESLPDALKQSRDFIKNLFVFNRKQWMNIWMQHTRRWRRGRKMIK
jgi:hypothetical protein